MRRQSAAQLTATLALLLASSSSAFGQEPPPATRADPGMPKTIAADPNPNTPFESCESESDHGKAARAKSHLREARKHFKACASAAQCSSSSVHEECAKLA